MSDESDGRRDPRLLFSTSIISPRGAACAARELFTVHSLSKNDTALSCLVSGAHADPLIRCIVVQDFGNPRMLAAS
jgi:hypothetical protein